MPGVGFKSPISLTYYSDTILLSKAWFAVGTLPRHPALVEAKLTDDGTYSEAPFAAGSMTWSHDGPSHHAQRRYNRIKVGVLLGATTARCRASEQPLWKTIKTSAPASLLAGQVRW